MVVPRGRKAAKRREVGEQRPEPEARAGKGAPGRTDYVNRRRHLEQPTLGRGGGDA